MTEHKLNFAGNARPGWAPTEVVLSAAEHIVLTRWQGSRYVDQVAYGVYASPGGIRAYDGATIGLAIEEEGPA